MSALLADPAPRLPGPLRDVARGVGLHWDMTAEILSPVVELLPADLRDGMRQAVDMVERSARAAIKAPTQTDIAAAAAFLDGRRTDRAGAHAFVRVWAQMADQASHKAPSGHFLVSELVARSAVASVPPGPPGPRRAARLIRLIRRRHAAGTVPGTPLSHSAEAARNADLTLFATALWLLAEREASLEEDLRVFCLAQALAHTVEGEVLAWLGEERALAAGLDRLAASL